MILYLLKNPCLRVFSNALKWLSVWQCCAIGCCLVSAFDMAAIGGTVIFPGE